MAYKTILVHLNREQRAAALLEYAIPLARQSEGRLIGLNVLPAFKLTPPVPVPFGGEVAARIRQYVADEVERTKTIFETMTSNQSFVPEWRSVTAEGLNVADAVLRHAMSADLVIASQSDPEWEFSGVFDCAGRLAAESGRPVIVVPNAGQFGKVPRIIAVAWKARREAARAAFDALPLLRAAERVHILTVDEDGRESDGEADLAEIAATLARHGVNITSGAYRATDRSAADEIRVRAADQAADLLVMGCYGHSRLREFAFGGVTRALLDDMSIPVLFSH
jgi:nucleotide-binding universal stress UspA family protein